MSVPVPPPAPLPIDKVDWEALSARRRELGTEPTPENSPDLFADELAMEGWALAQVEPFVPAASLLAAALDARDAIGRALQKARATAARQWLWTNRERCRLFEGRLSLPRDLTDDERKLLGICRAEVVKVLRDGDVLGWFVSGQPETPSCRGPSDTAPAGVV